ncbi:hypothetical protein AB9N12_06255 [Bacteroides sp. AN502(2024)]|uniref:hypothetical protein n=1 Tax=Bacteroides sp. AN502(2024) TaxID=3160599 RepID=UPI003513C6B8
MKVYRKNIFKHYVVWGCAIPLTIFFIYQRISHGSFNLYVIFFLLFLGIMSLIAATGFNYIILDNNRITLKNSFYFWGSSTFLYKDIEKIIFKDDTGKKAIYIRVVTHKKISCRYGLGCVHHSDLKEIIEELQKHNIKLEIGPDIVKDYLQ